MRPPAPEIVADGSAARTSWPPVALRRAEARDGRSSIPALLHRQVATRASMALDRQNAQANNGAALHLSGSDRIKSPFSSRFRLDNFENSLLRSILLFSPVGQSKSLNVL